MTSRISKFLFLGAYTRAQPKAVRCFQRVGGGVLMREIDFSLPSKQRQHCILHIQKDVLHYMSNSLL